MKKLSFIFILIFFHFTASSQPCLPDGITFSTQAEIDNFQINYPNCTEVEGDVIIGVYGSDITDLTGLNVLTSIEGDLTLKWNNSLTSLTGLDNVTSIEGSLTMISNTSLTS